MGDAMMNMDGTVSDLITASSEDDHIRVEIHRSCIVEWSDDQRNWHVFSGDVFELDAGVPVFKDYAVPLNGTRSYRAYDHQPDMVRVTRREPGYVVPSLEETRRKLAALGVKGFSGETP
jgi:hypothetical protein